WETRANGASAGSLSQRWNIRTLTDAYRPRPPVEYLVEGLFPTPSLNIVYGSPGTLKSMVLADMCICVAAGLPWLMPITTNQGNTFGVTQAPILWIDLDNGARRSDERFEALARSRDLDADT